MRCVTAAACGVFALALAGGPADGQAKKKTPQLPALAYDATVVKLEEKKGTPSRLSYKTSEEDAKKLGIKSDDIPITARTKFVFVTADGEKTMSPKAAAADAEAKKHLQPDSKIRVQVTAEMVEILRFGPGLQPQGPKRVR